MSKLSRIKHISDWISFLKKKCGISANNFAFSYLPQKHCCISSSCITAISVSVTLSFNCLHLAQVSTHSAFNIITQIRKDLKKKKQLFIIIIIPVVVIIPIIVVFLFLGVVSKNYCCGKPSSHLTCTLLVREIALNGLVLDINKICPKSVIFW